MGNVAVKAQDTSFIEEVCAVPGGEAIHSCIQCGTCTGSCPTAGLWDFPPREAIAMVRAGLKEELLASNSMWFCASCYACTVRCPRDIKPTEIMHALEVLAIKHGLATKRSRTPTLYRGFVDSAKNNGRVYEFGVMLNLIRRTNPFSALKLAPMGLGLLLRRRMPLRANRIKGTGEIKAIIKKARSLGGA